MEADSFEASGAQRDVRTLGMWLFLSTEVLFFGSLFLGYAVYRAQYVASFVAGSRELHLWLGTANTAMLLTSSLTMAVAVAAVRTGRRRLTALMIGSTLSLGVAFLCVKGVEYWMEYEAGLVPGLGRPGSLSGTSRRELFFNFYFTMTGLHAVHLTIGIGALIALFYRMVRGLGRLRNYVEITGLYWHFVDLVWVFLFPVLYLMDR